MNKEDPRVTVDRELHRSHLDLFFASANARHDLPTVDVRNGWPNCIFSGELRQKIRRWEDRFVVLTLLGVAVCFETPTSEEPCRKLGYVLIRDMKFWLEGTRDCVEIQIEMPPSSGAVASRGNSIRFLAESEERRLVWIDYFRKLGGHFLPDRHLYARFLSYNLPPRLSATLNRRGERMTKVSVGNWRAGMVRNWLLKFLTRDEVDRVERSIGRMTGETLLADAETWKSRLSKLQTEDILGEDRGRVAVLREAIELLRGSQVFVPFHEYWLNRFVGELLVAEDSLEIWRFHARCLIDPECMMETYLRLGSLEHSWTSFTPGKEDEPLCPGGFERSPLDDPVCSGIEFLDSAFRLSVRMVLVETGALWRANPNLHPVQDQLPTIDFDSSMTKSQIAIVFGPWLLVWDQRARVCVPWRFHMSLFGWYLFDLEIPNEIKHLEVRNVEECVARLAGFLCEVNLTKNEEYSSLDFFTDFCTLFEVDGFGVEGDDRVRSCLDLLSQQGQAFTLQLIHQPAWSRPSTEFRFRTHSEVDCLMREIEELNSANPFFTQDKIAMPEFFLLENYDRMFWCRRYRSEAECFRADQNGCAFSRAHGLSPRMAFLRTTETVAYRIGKMIALRKARSICEKFARNRSSGTGQARRGRSLFGSRSVKHVSQSVDGDRNLKLLDEVLSVRSRKTLFAIPPIFLHDPKKIEEIARQLPSSVEDAVNLQRVSQIDVHPARYVVVDTDEVVCQLLLDRYSSLTVAGFPIILSRDEPIHLINPDEVEASSGMGALLGTGAFGHVSRGVYRQHHRIALKKYFIGRPENLLEEELAQREKEVKMMLNLRHENVVRCYGCFVENDLFCKVLEFCDGGNLREFMDRIDAEDWNSSTKLDCLVQISRGLRHIHLRNYVHRDLKPQNILVSNDSGFKICDFDLSRNQDSISSINKAGTLRYMASQRVVGPVEKVDVYSFGILCWEIWTGLKPYAEESVQFGDELTLFVAIHSTPPLRPDASLIDDEVIRDLCMRCWSVEPQDRPGSADIVVLLEGMLTAVARRD